ncbi:hypothetical protein [Enterobacter hormaechei]
MPDLPRVDRPPDRGWIAVREDDITEIDAQQAAEALALERIAEAARAAREAEAAQRAAAAQREAHR